MKILLKKICYLICVWQMKPTEVIFWADLFWQSQFAWVVTSMMRNRDKVRGLSIKGSWKQKNFLDTTLAVLGTFKNYMEGLGTWLQKPMLLISHCKFANFSFNFQIHSLLLCKIHDVGKKIAKWWMSRSEHCDFTKRNFSSARKVTN